MLNPEDMVAGGVISGPDDLGGQDIKAGAQMAHRISMGPNVGTVPASIVIVDKSMGFGVSLVLILVSSLISRVPLGM